MGIFVLGNNNRGSSMVNNDKGAITCPCAIVKIGRVSGVTIIGVLRGLT